MALRARLFAVVGPTKAMVFVTRWAQSAPRSSIKRNCVAVRYFSRETYGCRYRSPFAGVPVVLWRKGVRDFVQHHLLAFLRSPHGAQVLRHRNGSSAVVAQSAAFFALSNRKTHESEFLPR
jgi:hypothetical protein